MELYLAEFSEFGQMKFEEFISAEVYTEAKILIMTWNRKQKQVLITLANLSFSLCKMYKTIRAIQLNTRWQFNYAGTSAPLKE